jgi:hypothetical protein
MIQTECRSVNHCSIGDSRRVRTVRVIQVLSGGADEWFVDQLQQHDTSLSVGGTMMHRLEVIIYVTEVELSIQ